MIANGESDRGPISAPSLAESKATAPRHRTQAQSRVVRDHCLKVFMEGWEGCSEPSVTQVAVRLDEPLKSLLSHAENAKWLETRALTKMSTEKAMQAERGNLAVRVDKVVLEYSEKVVGTAAKEFDRLLGVVTGMGDDPQPRETAEGSPVKSELEVKVALIARLTQAYMALAQGAKALGLVRVGGHEDAGAQTLDPAKLAGLSLQLRVVRDRIEKTVMPLASNGDEKGPDPVKDPAQ